MIKIFSDIFIKKKIGGTANSVDPDQTAPLGKKREI